MAACSTTYCSFSLDTTTSRAQSYRYTRSSEEETEHKAKGQAKKEKHLAKEKGHAKPDSLLDKTERLRLVEYIWEGMTRKRRLLGLMIWLLSSTVISNYEKELEEMKHMTSQEYVASLRRWRIGSGYRAEVCLHLGLQ